ncbi:hypothetical protein B0H13DRAFT_1653272 [Mycena leptocephala]|nr:hypothetical protein B0H13DRAFT_1653272 [Mycena leptocephala]
MREPSLTFSNLIYRCSGKFANWDPSHPIEESFDNLHFLVGDFGTVDKKTGEFQKDGNIFTDPIIRVIVASEVPRSIALRMRMHTHFQRVARAQKLNCQRRQIPGIATAALHGNWQFTTKTGALLSLYRPQSSYIQELSPLLKKLAMLPQLKKKRLVTEVIRCHTYALYLSQIDGGTLALALVLQAPVPGGAPVQAAVNTQGRWIDSHTTGIFRAGAFPADPSYYPLYRLKTVKKSRLSILSRFIGWQQ